MERRRPAALGGPKGQRGAHALGNFDNPRDIAYSEASCTSPISATSACRCSTRRPATPSRRSPALGDACSSPIGISAGVDGSGNPIILVSQDVKNQVTALNLNGVTVGHFGRGTSGSGNGQLKGPRDAATDAAGDVYVVDYGNDRIAKFQPNGTWIKNWGRLGRR